MTVVSWYYSSVHSHWHSKEKVRRFVSHYHDCCFKSAKTLALANKLFDVHLINWVIGFQMTGIFADNNFKSFLKVSLFTLKIWGHRIRHAHRRSLRDRSWPIWNSSGFANLRKNLAQYNIWSYFQQPITMTRTKRFCFVEAETDKCLMPHCVVV